MSPLEQGKGNGMAKLDSLDISELSKQSGQKFLTAFMPFKRTTRNHRNIFPFINLM